MPFTKVSHAEAQTKIAEIDRRDAANAYEVGFMKAAQDMELNEAQFSELYKLGLEVQAAEQAATK